MSALSAMNDFINVTADPVLAALPGLNLMPVAGLSVILAAIPLAKRAFFLKAALATVVAFGWQLLRPMGYGLEPLSFDFTLETATQIGLMLTTAYACIWLMHGLRVMTRRLIPHAFGAVAPRLELSRVPVTNKPTIKTRLIHRPSYVTTPKQ